MSTYTIACDLGIASVGWALLKDGDVIALGSRIFRDGRNAKSHQTDNAKRRTARSMRRQYKHKRMRRGEVARAIQTTINPTFHTAKTLPNLKRKTILTTMQDLDGQAFLDAICCALRFLSRARGPEYEWSEKKIPDRLGKIKGKMPWLRDECKREFERIWQIGVGKRSDLFTDEAKAKIHEAIFFQRPINDGNRGPCQFIDGEVRGWTQDPAIQRLIIRAALSNLSVVFRSGAVNPLSDYHELMDEFEKTAWQKTLSFAAITSRCKKFFGTIFDRIGGDEGQMQVGRKGVGPAKTATIDDTGESIKSTANMSVKAAEILYAIMVRGDDAGRGMREGEAIHYLRQTSTFMPALSKKDIPDGRAMLSFDEVVHFQRDGDHTDPSVRVCYGQVKAVVDDVMKNLVPIGEPVAIRFESAKQVGRGTDARREYMDFQRANRERNESIGTTSIIERVKEMLGSRCIVCDDIVSQFCHAIPDAIGGERKVANGLPICKACNEEMGSRTPHEWGKDNENARIAFDAHAKRIEVKSKESGIDKKTKGVYNDHLWRFGPTARKTFTAQFRPGSVEELRYIEKLVGVGMAPIDKDPMFVRSGAVAKARYMLGVKKDRGDHRHHAIDAAIVGIIDFDENGKVVVPENLDADNLMERAVVSHRPDRSKSGALHNETIVKHALATKSLVEIGEGQHRKYARPDANWAFEVYELPDGKWMGFCVTRFAASQPNFRAGVTMRPHPCAKVKLRLHGHDTIKAKGELWRVKRMTGSTVSLVPVAAASPDAKLWICSASALKAGSAKRVNLSPAAITFG